MTQAANFKWPQGEDLNIQLAYKEGASESKALPVNLSSGYSVRMDLIARGNDTPVYSFTGGSEVLGTGANRQANINIYLPRSLTLPGGALIGTPGTFNYDLFLRNTTTDRQIKILRGNISIEMSNTLWL